MVPNTQIEAENRKGRRLMETSNMFSAYRNSLKTGNGPANVGGQLLMQQQHFGGDSQSVTPPHNP